MTKSPERLRIEATYADLDSWRDRAKQEPRLPLEGSDLAYDNQVFPHHPISESIRFSLNVSGEHLRMAGAALDAGQYFPTAHFTVLRGALLGASQAVWALAPDDPMERQANQLGLLSAMYTQLRSFYADKKEGAGSREEGDALDEEIRWCREQHDEANRLRGTDNALDSTSIISQALRHAFTDRTIRRRGRLLWRELGGDAHVLGWSTMQRAEILTSNPLTHIGVAQTGTSLAPLANAVEITYGLLAKGWQLFDLRGAVAA